MITISPYVAPGLEPITLESVVSAVCEHYWIEVRSIGFQSRRQRFVRPRYVIMHLARILTKASLETIADRLGYGDHTTVIHGLETIKNDMAQDEQLRATVEEIKAKIEKRK